MTTTIVLVAIDLLGLAAIWLYVKFRLRRALELDGLLEGLRKELRILNIELNETTERNISLVEDRMETLRSLLDEADRRVGVVRKEFDNRAQEREVYSRLGKPRLDRASATSLDASLEREGPPKAEIRPRPAVPAQDPREAQAEDGPALEGHAPGFPALRGEEPIRLDLGRKPADIVTKESVIPPKTMREAALELYNRGFSADIIAAKLGATVAEIDLLISLEEGRRMGEEA